MPTMADKVGKREVWIGAELSALIANVRTKGRQWVETVTVPF